MQPGQYEKLPIDRDSQVLNELASDRFTHIYYRIVQPVQTEFTASLQGYLLAMTMILGVEGRVLRRVP